MTDFYPGPSWRVITLLLLMANFLFGIGVAAVLPPFEGPDETAHFSRLQSQAFTSQSANPASRDENVAKINQRITTDVIDYYHRGPMPYHWIYLDSLHVNDKLRGYSTYHDFFEQPQRVADYIVTYQESPVPTGYNPGPDYNWQYQHPGLFYVVIGQAMKLFAGHVSLIPAFMILRLLCYAMAFAGFCIGLLSTRKYLQHTGVGDADAITALGTLYPFLAPAFFWEFARLGNDSLCLFLFGIIWALLLWHMRAPRSDAWIYLGLVVGLGLLVKILMLPIAGGILAFLVAYHLFVTRKNPGYAHDWWVQLLKSATFLFLVTVSIYIVNRGVGGGDYQLAFHKQNLWAAWEQNFSWSEFLRNTVGIAQTAIWLFGSWSLLIIDIPVYLFLAIFTTLIGLFYVMAVWRRPGAVFLLALWLLVALAVGLMSHILLAIVLGSHDMTPGYYMHILAPALALIYGMALSRALRRRWSKLFMACLCAPIIALNFFIAWSYMTAFSGCAVPSQVDGIYHGIYLLHPADILRCAEQIHNVVSNLGVLAWPILSLVCIGLAFILLLVAGFLAFPAISNRRGTMPSRTVTDP